MIAALNKLFATCPLPSANTDPNQALKVYCEACSNYSADDVELAVKQFIEGTVKGVNAAFAPTAPQFVSQMRANLEYTGRIRAGKTALLEQFKEQERDEEWASKRTPEVKATVKKLVDAFVANQDEKRKPKTPEQLALEADMIRRHDKLFADQFMEFNGVKVSATLAGQFGVVLTPPDDVDETGDMGEMRE